MVEIPDDRGFCLNGRCFDRETLRQLEKEPFSRKSFDVLDDPGYALFEAVDRGDTALVGRLLAVPGIDVNAKDEYGMTALMAALIRAAYQGYTDIVRLLLVAGADGNAKGEIWGDTALIAAATRGRTAVVELLLDVPGIDVNAKDTDGDTALKMAARRGHTDIVNLIRGLIARRRFRGVVRLGRPLRDAKVRAAERVYAPPGAFLDEEGGPGYIEVFNRQMPNFEEGVDE